MDVNKIYCGDSLKLIDELDVTPNLIIMSPPDLAETNYTLKEYKEFINIIYSKCMSKLHKNGVLISSTTDRKMDGIYTKHIDIINSVLATRATLFNYKIWVKSLKINLFILNYTHLLFFRKDKLITNNKLKEFYPDVWILENDKIEGYKTKDSFPTELVKRFILNFTNKEDLVFDPFIGSGKTAKVAKDLGRKYIGFEIDPKNVEIANKLVDEKHNI